MQKKYVVRLTDEERAELAEVIKKLKGTSQKVRRAQILLKADAEGPNWTDRQIAEAYGCRTKTVENVRVLSATVQNLAGPAGGWLVLAGLAGRGCSGGAGEVAGVARWRTIGKEAAWPPWQVRSDYGGTVKRGAVNRPPLPRRARDMASNGGDAKETLCGPRWMSGHRSGDHGIFGREVARSRDVAGGCAGTHAFAGGGTFALNSRPAADQSSRENAPPGEWAPALSVFLRGDPWLESCCRAERMA
jgi:hypothetical protein